MSLAHFTAHKGALLQSQSCASIITIVKDVHDPQNKTHQVAATFRLLPTLPSALTTVDLSVSMDWLSWDISQTRTHRLQGSHS